LPAEQAAAWGLIWRCVEDGELAATVDALALQFASAPTRGLARTKQAIYESFSRTLDQQLRIERDHQGELCRSAAYAAGGAAFPATGRAGSGGGWGATPPGGAGGGGGGEDPTSIGSPSARPRHSSPRTGPRGRSACA